ncbi:hypothetical protein AB1L42_22330 [Thalassoglobus sp. JC818]|uniref:hypothetical protein n=1 Tax=Thalassoglobus sp. JC818 TaxID=3232136 RepID=UPI00345A0453
MFFRLLALVVVLTVVSVAEISLQKRTLARKRQVSQLYQQLDVLDTERAKLFLVTQELGAAPILHSELDRSSRDQGTASASRLPQHQRRR